MRTRIHLLRAILVGSVPGLLAVGLAACGKPVVFQGKSTLPIAGQAPAPVEAPKPPPRVEVRNNKIEIHEKIQFDYDKATIKPESFDLMNEIVSVVEKNPQIKKIRVEGYASSEGSASHNMKLSAARASSVMKYMVDHGVSKDELSSKGFGVDDPIADNSTEEGREKNRRVEFSIMEQDVTNKTVQIDPTTGKEKVIDEKHETVTTPGAGQGDATAGKAAP
jgi:outer membrane protein OmpA-like peptidoglycan-associated protein